MLLSIISATIGNLSIILGFLVYELFNQGALPLEQYNTPPTNTQTNTKMIEIASNYRDSVVKVSGVRVNNTVLWPVPIPTAEITSGTGFIISSNGSILTNKHVVEDNSEKYTVTLNNGFKYNVQSIIKDQSNDLALIKIDPNQHLNYNFTPLGLGDSSNINVGETVGTISSDPRDSNFSINSGEISGFRRTIIASDSNGNAERLNNMIEIDLHLVPGNSGSPLLDQNGEVIGVCTAIDSGQANDSFAIPINSAKAFVNSVQ